MQEFRTATLRDMVSLAPRMRAADVAELKASSGRDPFTALCLSFGTSKRTWVYTVDGQVECAFGIAEITRDVGCPWMLGSDEVRNHSKRLIRDAMSVVEDMQAAYPTLFNQTHERNTVALRWLRYLGFKFLPAVQHGPQNEAFIPFYRHNNV